MSLLNKRFFIYSVASLAIEFPITDLSRRFYPFLFLFLFQPIQRIGRVTLISSSSFFFSEEMAFKRRRARTLENDPWDGKVDSNFISSIANTRLLIFLDQVDA